jgi:hypothetical protein
LREAFSAMTKDPGFIGDAKKQNLELTPVDGDDVQALLERVSKTPKHVIERMNDAQIYKGERGRAKSAEPDKK